jgi:hypothetical protein
MAQGDYDAEVVDEVKAGAEELAARPLWPEGRRVAANEGVGDEKTGNEEAEESNDLVGREGGAAHHFHDAVGEDPAGEAADGEKNRG